MRRASWRLGAFTHAQVAFEYAVLLGGLFAFFFLPIKWVVPVGVVAVGVLIRACNSRD